MPYDTSVLETTVMGPVSLSLHVELRHGLDFMCTGTVSYFWPVGFSCQIELLSVKTFCSLSCMCDSIVFVVAGLFLHSSLIPW